MFKRIFIPVWNHTVIVSMAQTDEDFRSHLLTEFKELSLEDLLNNCSQIATLKGWDARTARMPGGNVIVRTECDLQTPKGKAILVHELFHAAWFILDRCGLKPSDDSEESYAYLLQYLVNEALIPYPQPTAVRH